jgi:peptide/nickel transport system permease protein
MARYFIRRVLLVIPTVIGVTFFVFLLVRLIPGGATSAILGENATPKQAALLKHELGLDQPIPTQYIKWVGHALQGDLGRSVVNGTVISHDVRTRIGWTFELGGFAILFSLLVALPVGVLAAIRQDTIFDYIARSAAVAFLAVPSFWLATLLIVYGSIGLSIGPLNLHFTPPLGKQISASLAQNLQLIIPPAIILGIGLSGAVMRLTRTQMLEVMRQDYVRTARAKGLREHAIILRHAFRNAFIPVLTIIGLQVPVIVGGSVILEQIFSLPGMGFYLIGAINQRDFTVIQGVVVLSATIVIVSNLLVDFAYPLLDPRIRYG